MQGKCKLRAIWLGQAQGRAVEGDFPVRVQAKMNTNFKHISKEEETSMT